MKSAIALAAVALAQAAAAYPLHAEERNLTERAAPYGVYLCTDINFGGQCEHVFPPLDQSCFNLHNPFYKTVSSIGPDHNVAVTFHEKTDCSDYCAGQVCSSFGSQYPGDKDLRDKGWNDRLVAISVNTGPYP